jgi:hypothetical protein
MSRDRTEGHSTAMADLEKRRKLARLMKLAILLVPLVVVAIAVEAISGGVSATTAIGAALVCYGAIASYRYGSSWETHWNERLDSEQSSNTSRT